MMVVKKSTSLKGVVKVDSDKSISHRSVIFCSVCEGVSEIDGFLMSEDCLNTINCLRQLGVRLEVTERRVVVYGKGLLGLRKPEKALYVGNSGTSIRLLSGLLSGQNFDSTLYGDESVCKRPMKRITYPLKLMGAKIESVENEYAPLNIHASELSSITYEMPIASAQVKSAILLASLYCCGDSLKATQIIEPLKSRNHSEIMLNYLGGRIEVEGNRIISKGVNNLYARNIKIGGDISSAAFFIVAGILIEGSHIVIEDVCVNETRIGIIRALKEMGGDIVLLNERIESGEKVADIEVKHSELRGIELKGELIPLMIDEIPIFSIACLFAKGDSEIKDAAELKVKESDRIKTMVTELKKMNANIEETKDGMIIGGKSSLKGCRVESYGDHRVAMSLAIAGLCSEGETIIDGDECIKTSFPNFWKCLKTLMED